MLGQIDEELENSRGFSSRLERYMPGRRYKPRQRALHKRLWAAVSANHDEKVVAILASGRGIIDINYADEKGFTPLHQATSHGYEGIVAVLLEHGHIDVHRQDIYGLTALQWAERKRRYNIVAQLKAYPSYKPAIRVEEDQNVDNGGICCEMLTLPPKLSARDIAVSTENQRALWDACETNDMIKVARLIRDKKADINCLNQHGRTPLSIAASHGYHAIVSWLLGYDGVDPAITDANGATALTWAASRGHIRVVQLLLCHEVVSRRDESVIAASMALAQRNGHKEIVEMLTLDWEAISSLPPMYHISAWTSIT
jgi:ankyrin repeat protein